MESSLQGFRSTFFLNITRLVIESSSFFFYSHSLIEFMIINCNVFFLFILIQQSPNNQRSDPLCIMYDLITCCVSPHLLLQSAIFFLSFSAAKSPLHSFPFFISLVYDIAYMANISPSHSFSYRGSFTHPFPCIVYIYVI